MKKLLKKIAICASLMLLVTGCGSRDAEGMAAGDRTQENTTGGGRRRVKAVKRLH